jgi:hypothetical protein
MARLGTDNNHVVRNRERVSDAQEAMEMLDQIWSRPKKAKEIHAKYAEQNKAILERERILELRMRKNRLSKLDSMSTRTKTRSRKNAQRRSQPPMQKPVSRTSSFRLKSSEIIAKSSFRRRPKIRFQSRTKEMGN